MTRAEVKEDVLPPLRDTIGLCQWFHFEDHLDVERTVEALHDLGVRHLRTGIAWADLHRPRAKEWFDWQMAQLARGGFEVLLSVWHTPPSLSVDGTCNGPPRRLRDYADAIDQIITNWGDSFSHLELWNEPNNAYKWNFPAHDPAWERFAEMIRDAAHWATRGRGKPTVLGGMIPVDHHWLDLLDSHGALANIDVIAIHAFPGMWWPGERNWDWHDQWTGWQAKLDSISPHTRGRPIWVTETGVATWDLALNRVAKYDLQVQMLDDVARHCTA
jgi:CDP-paratose 2-epimerase